MVKTPESVATFLRGRRIAVAGVSRHSSEAANAVFRKLRHIVGGCPLMFCDPIDFGHKCMRWWLQRQNLVPG